jgi:biopolymer transport protein ExbD
MTFNRQNGQDEGDVFQLAPMVDIVFTLLAFFVLAAQFNLHEIDFGMRYRPQSGAAAASARDLPSNITVELRKVPAGVAITLGQARLADNDFDGLSKKLAEINLPEVEVTVAGDPTLSVDEVARGLDAVLASPMKRVSLGRLAVASGKGGRS